MNCRHCFRGDAENVSIEKEYIDKLLCQCEKIKTLCFTGGEPFLEPDVIDYAIDYVKKYHYIDDLRLAQNYVRYHKQNLSRRQIYVKLIQKGVEPENIENALDKEYDADEIEHIYNLLEKKKYDKENCDDKEFRRIYQFLLRRGFKSSQILTAMRKGRD